MIFKCFSLSMKQICPAGLMYCSWFDIFKRVLGVYLNLTELTQLILHQSRKWIQLSTLSWTSRFEKALSWEWNSLCSNAESNFLCSLRSERAKSPSLCSAEDWELYSLRIHTQSLCCVWSFCAVKKRFDLRILGFILSYWRGQQEQLRSP